MRRYGLYDATRGLMTALAVGLAGLLLWVATQVGQQSAARFWEEMGIVAAAGLVLALLPALGGWTSGLRLRLSAWHIVLVSISGLHAGRGFGLRALRHQKHLLDVPQPAGE